MASLAISHRTVSSQYSTITLSKPGGFRGQTLRYNITWFCVGFMNSFPGFLRSFGWSVSQGLCDYSVIVFWTFRYRSPVAYFWNLSVRLIKNKIKTNIMFFLGWNVLWLFYRREILQFAGTVVEKCGCIPWLTSLTIEVHHSVWPCGLRAWASPRMWTGPGFSELTAKASHRKVIKYRRAAVDLII